MAIYFLFALLTFSFFLYPKTAHYEDEMGEWFAASEIPIGAMANTPEKAALAKRIMYICRASRSPALRLLPLLRKAFAGTLLDRKRKHRQT